MHVFRVEDDTNRYCGFRDRRSDILNDLYQKMLQGVSIIKRWTKSEVDLLPGTLGDFVGGPVIFARIAVGTHARDTIGQLLQTCCELLPFDHERLSFWSLYLPKTSPCLDVAKSEFWSSTPDNSQIKTHAFLMDRVPNDLLFRLPGSFHYYATDEFHSLVRKHALTGLTFRMVWSSDTSATIGANENKPVAQSAREPRVSGRRMLTKRERLLARLWRDAIDSWVETDRLEQLMRRRTKAELPAITGEGIEVIELLQSLGVAPQSLKGLLRAVAYQIVFDVLESIEEEGLDRNAALRALHEDLLLANPNP